MLSGIANPIEQIAAAVANKNIFASGTVSNKMKSIKFLSSILKNVSTAKNIPTVIDKIMQNVRNNSADAFGKNLFIVSMTALIIGTPGTKNNAQATVGFNYSVGKRYAKLVAMNAANAIDKNSLTLYSSNFI